MNNTTTKRVFRNEAHPYAFISFKGDSFSIVGLDDKGISDKTIIALHEGTEIDGWELA